MASLGSGYDLSVATFSPNGRVIQVDYAMKAVENTGLTMGAVFKDGILLAVDKYLPSKLSLDTSATRVFRLANHVICAVAGSLPDARMLVIKARKECSDYEATWGVPISGAVLADRIGLFVHAHTAVWSTRPVGCSILIGVADNLLPKKFPMSSRAVAVSGGNESRACDMTDDTASSRSLAENYSLWLVDATGAAYKYRGTAMARSAAGAKSDLERMKLDELTAEDGVIEFAKCLTQHHQEFREYTMKMEMIWLRFSDNNKADLVPHELMVKAEQAGKDYLDAMDA